MTVTLLPTIARKVQALAPNVAEIPENRRDLLASLAEEIGVRHLAGGPVLLNFICTHNSRRSQFGQVWGAVAAAASGVDVQTFSGGTEVTAMNPRAVAALVRAGFPIETRQGGTPGNPHYAVSYAQNTEPLRCYSKLLDAPENPSRDFIAIMTCGEADANCPVVVGAKRVPLLYDDPKVADDTPEEAARYDERSDQIASELLWVFKEACRTAAARSGK